MLERPIRSCAPFGGDHVELEGRPGLVSPPLRRRFSGRELGARIILVTTHEPHQTRSWKARPPRRSIDKPRLKVKKETRASTAARARPALHPPTSPRPPARSSCIACQWTATQRRARSAARASNTRRSSCFRTPSIAASAARGGGSARPSSRRRPSPPSCRTTPTRRRRARRAPSRPPNREDPGATRTTA